MNRYLAIEIPADARITAIAQEAALIDADLDDLERRVRSPAIAPQEAAALSLTIARAARRSSIPVLREVHARLAGAGRELEAKALILAAELANLRPPPNLERGDEGYRRTDAASGETLFIEDPVAAHWHKQGRWGPPLRPDLDRAQIYAGARGDLGRLEERIQDGAVALVSFRASRLFGPQPVLRLLRAGLARDAALDTFVRWSEVISVGSVENRRGQVAAYEVFGGRVERLPPEPSIGTGLLVALMTKLLKLARAC